ncbi:MAG: hypothetical protein DMF90_26455 [Acidobacteria bacterium]|nr:MAG: hypothetical protein DMF90_26455 [Acidobacteriota bacterium]
MATLCLDVSAAAATIGVSPWLLRHHIAESLLRTVPLSSVQRPGEASRRVLVVVAETRSVRRAMAGSVRL